METLELPVLEHPAETPAIEDDIDLAAFRLWREASRLGTGTEEDPQPVERG